MTGRGSRGDHIKSSNAKVRGYSSSGRPRSTPAASVETVESVTRDVQGGQSLLNPDQQLEVSSAL